MSVISQSRNAVPIKKLCNNITNKYITKSKSQVKLIKLYVLSQIVSDIIMNHIKRGDLQQDPVLMSEIHQGGRVAEHVPYLTDVGHFPRHL